MSEKKALKARGSILLEILAVILAVGLIFTLTFPQKMWNKEEKNVEMCHENMWHIYFAEITYLDSKLVYNDTLENVIGFILSDSTEKLLRRYTSIDSILGMDIKGHTVHRVLVAEASDIAEEYYVSFLLDRANRCFLAMASVEGGVEIEEVAATNPDALAKIRVDALEGVSPALAREIADAAGFPEAIRAQRHWYAVVDATGGGSGS